MKKNQYFHFRKISDLSFAESGLLLFLLINPSSDIKIILSASSNTEADTNNILKSLEEKELIFKKDNKYSINKIKLGV